MKMVDLSQGCFTSNAKKPKWIISWGFDGCPLKETFGVCPETKAENKKRLKNVRQIVESRHGHRLQGTLIWFGGYTIQESARSQWA